jgi:orotate phosphoribosyltransferase
MKMEEVIEIYKRHSALMKGHFLLSSGLHSDTYLQSELVMQYPFVAKLLMKELAKKIYNFDFSTILSPAIGGIRSGYELARTLNKRSIFVERVEGRLALRRGFSIIRGEKILVMEDVITTGKSTIETIEVAKSFDANIVLVSALVDRSEDDIDFGVPLIPLVKFKVYTYLPDNCELCKKGIPLVSPGSRHNVKL